MIKFDQRDNELIFNRKYLDLPVLISNPEFLESLKTHAKKLQKRLYPTDTFTSRVETSIMERFLSGKFDINVISKHLAMGTRSLQNRLKAEGATYKELLEGVKREQTKYFLEQPDISIIDIAFLLGYSDQSSFNRAFKKWTGFTPGGYRFKCLSKVNTVPVKYSF